MAPKPEQAFLNEDNWVGSSVRASKGMWPKEYKLDTGTVLYRFAGNATSRAADGPWWFEREYYQKIVTFAQRNQYSTEYCVRLFAAILYEWSDVKAVIRAQTIGPLRAWKGKGKQVEATGRDSRDSSSIHGLLTDRSPNESPMMTPMQNGLAVYQIYIPGLRKPLGNLHRYMRIIGKKKI